MLAVLKHPFYVAPSLCVPEDGLYHVYIHAYIYICTRVSIIYMCVHSFVLFFCATWVSSPRTKQRGSDQDGRKHATRERSTNVRELDTIFHAFLRTSVSAIYCRLLSVA